jgi:site-specific recombinase XerD
LKEIGDHLGHRDVEATRIYAKVDLVRLREVGDFDLGELL